MKRFLYGIIFILVIFVAFPRSVIAQSGDTLGWSPDERVPGYFDDTFTPFLLADHNGTIHAFATQLGKDKNAPKVIDYRQWTLGGGWTRPVDILISPTSESANIMGAYLDTFDVIHVIFTAKEPLSQKISVYHSSAPAVNADWVPAWSEPTLVGSNALEINSGAIIGDDQGNLVIIYSGNRDGSGVYSMYSKDNGRSWSDPSPIYLTNDSNLSTFSLRLTIGPEQKIRSAWNVVTNLGVDEALYFANFDSKNLKWDLPVELDRRIDLPDYFGPSYPVIVDNGKEIIVMYNSGNPFTGRPVNPGRPIQRVRISTDGGFSWNEPLDPFPFHLGRSGEHTMVIDGEGTPHTLFIQRIEETGDNGEYKVIGGVWHSAFQNGVWSSPDRFLTTLPAVSNIRAVVSQGNVLLAVWIEDQGIGQDGVWYSYTLLDVPRSPVRAISTVPVVQSTLAAGPSNIPAFSSPTPLSFPSQLRTNDGQKEYNPAMPLTISAIVVILLVVAFVIYYYLNQNVRGK